MQVFHDKVWNFMVCHFFFFEKNIEKGPSSVEAGLLVAMIRFFFLDDVESAMAVTKELLQERPSSVYLCASLAGMHRYKGEVKEAEEIQLRGYELSVEYEQLHLSQGSNVGFGGVLLVSPVWMIRLQFVGFVLDDGKLREVHSTGTSLHLRNF